MLIPVVVAPKQQNQFSKANCAGQGCPERKFCRRYAVRIGEVGRQQWASFDIERGFFGDCMSFARLVMGSH